MKKYLTGIYKISFISIMTGILFLCASGCSKKQKEIPMERSTLLLEIFDCLEQKDYAAALNKSGRLKKNDQTSVFLEELQHLIRANLKVTGAQKFMSLGKYDEAIKSLDGAIRQYGKQNELVFSLEQAEELAKINRLTDELKQIEDPAELFVQARTLADLTKEMPQASKITEFAERKMVYAQNLAIFQRDRMVFGLYMDYIRSRESGVTRDSLIPEAVFSLEQQKESIKF